jgi:hypothetical protein
MPWLLCICTTTYVLKQIIWNLCTRPSLILNFTSKTYQRTLTLTSCHQVVLPRHHNYLFPTKTAKNKIISLRHLRWARGDCCDWWDYLLCLGCYVSAQQLMFWSKLFEIYAQGQVWFWTSPLLPFVIYIYVSGLVDFRPLYTCQ